jgi:hypothetical protein
MRNCIYLSSVLIILSMGFLSSCSKDDDNLVSGEAIGSELQSIIAQQDIGFVRVYEYQWDNFFEEYRWIELTSATSNFEIHGVFIQVSDYNFNLEQLYRYETSGNVLELYFIL